MKSRATIKLSVISSLLLALTSTGCTLNEGDPQATLCQKLTAQISNKQVQWGATNKAQQSDKSMKVEVSSSDNSLKGICIYKSDADDAGKDYDVNILDGYQNIPTSMVINGTQVQTKQLYIAIQQVTGQSVEDTLRKL